MTQATNWGVPEAAEGQCAPATMAERINDSLDAALSSHGGAERPSYAVAGTIWRDTDTGQLFLYDGTADTELVQKVDVPASASATGKAGQIAFDASYVYLCVATDTWVRASVATW